MNFLRTGFTMLAVFAVILQSSAQIKEYILDATHPTIENVQPIDMKGINLQGTTLTVNSRYFSKNGKPWLPVMGEFHYIRYPEQYWEEELVKMKAGGITVVTTYVFWNAHEYPKGTWNWSPSSLHLAYRHEQTGSSENNGKA